MTRMAEGVQVDQQYLRSLAAKQTQAGAMIRRTSDDTGFGEDIATSHGVWVRAGVNAILKALDARRSAGDQVAANCDALAERLNQADLLYAATDQQQASVLDKQMTDS